MCAEDSGNQRLHPLTKKLGLLSQSNGARDWWRLLDDGPDTWNISDHQNNPTLGPVLITRKKNKRTV